MGGQNLIETCGTRAESEDSRITNISHKNLPDRTLAREETGGVRLMSMSQSKGLTVDSAIVLGVEEGMVPLDRPDIEVNEERRLLYVAMTRATDFCVLTRLSHKPLMG